MAWHARHSAVDVAGRRGDRDANDGDAGRPVGIIRVVVKDGIAKVQPVKVARVMDSQSILEGGLEGGELVVTE